MSSLKSRSALFLTLLTAGSALVSACTKAPPPAPTAAWVQPGRPGVTVQRAGQTLPVAGALRIEEDSLVATPAGVRSSLFLGRGAWVLLDEKTTVLVGEKRLEVRAGRAWIDARGGDEIEIVAGEGKVSLSAKGAGLSVSPRSIADNYVSLFALVRSGHFASIVPDAYAGPLAGVDWCRFIPIEPEAELRRLGLVVVNRDPLGSMARAGLTVAQQLAASDMIENFYHPSNLSI